jgi:farnesol dehydrogenase
MKVFLTGGTGFIGAHLINALIEEGKHVHALVRTPAKASSLPVEGVTIFKGDILDPKSIKEAMEGCEEVYHLGGNASIYEKDPKRYFTINVDGTQNVMDAAIDLGIKRMVFTSTAGVLGPSVGGVVTEDKKREIGFFNEYESSKAEAEALVRKYVEEKDIEVMTVSPTRVYGYYLFGEPASVSLLISKYIKGNWKIIPGDGTKVGNYVYVDDVVSGHMLAMKNGAKGETYILGGENYSYNEFFKVLKDVSGQDYGLIKTPIWAQMIFARLNKFFSLLFGKKPALTTKWVRRGNYHWEVDPSKSVRELGVEITPLGEGIRKTIEGLS